MGSLTPDDNVSTRLARIAELSSYTPKMVLRSLAQHITPALMREAYQRTRKSGATGADGVTATEFAVALEDNLSALRDGLLGGSYRAPPVRRVHIPKGDGRTRPIGIPTFADKVLQRAVAMVLEAVYEQDFLDCSFGFRPGRSAHQALDALWRGVMDMGGAFVIELDITSFFDTMDHTHLRAFLDQRICDGVLRRAIDKWLKAGVLENGQVARSVDGTPQGGVISPLLANIYLHHVLDVWFQLEVQPRLHAKSMMVRYADDAVLAFASLDDARRVLDVLPKRFARFGLTLHPVKTRQVDFRRPSSKDGGGDCFDFLGFTHFWGRSRKGRPVVQRKTARSRFARSMKLLWVWCRHHRHTPVREQHARLVRMLRGHYNYFGVTGNIRALMRFNMGAKRAWFYWLSRRSQRGMTWDKFKRILERYRLPAARILHSVYAIAK